MLLLNFYGTSLQLPYLAPITCYYTFLSGSDGSDPEAAGLSMCVRDHDQMAQYAANPDNYASQCLLLHVRVPECDAEETIINRNAYTSVMMTSKDTEGLSRKNVLWYFAGSLDVLRYIRREKLVSAAYADDLERWLFASLPARERDFLRRVAHRFMDCWCSKAASVYLAPDYMWRSGRRCNKRTVEWLCDHIEANTS